jgi:hypothetical protein
MAHSKNDNISIYQIVTSKMEPEAKDKLKAARSAIGDGNYGSWLHDVASNEHYVVTVIKRDGTPVTFSTDDRQDIRNRVENLIHDWKVYLGKIGEVEVGDHSKQMIEAYRQMTYGAEPMEIFIAVSHRNDPLNNHVKRMTVNSFMAASMYSACGVMETWRVLPDHV